MWRDLRIKSTLNDRSFEKLFTAIFIYVKSFCQKSAEKNSPKKYFSYFCFCLCLDSNPGFSFNKPTHYLLDLRLIKKSSVALAALHVAPLCWNQMLPISSSSIFVHKNSFNTSRWRSPLTVTASPCSFSKKNGQIMPVDQTVTRFGCFGFSLYACRFVVPQMRQFCFFTYPPRSKWASTEKMLFFAKIGIFCKSIAGSLSETYT